MTVDLTAFAEAAKHDLLNADDIEQIVVEMRRLRFALTEILAYENSRGERASEFIACIAQAALEGVDLLGAKATGAPRSAEDPLVNQGCIACGAKPAVYRCIPCHDKDVREAVDAAQRVARETIRHLAGQRSGEAPAFAENVLGIAPDGRPTPHLRTSEASPEPLCSCENPTDPAEAYRCENCGMPTREIAPEPEWKRTGEAPAFAENVLGIAPDGTPTPHLRTETALCSGEENVNEDLKDRYEANRAILKARTEEMNKAHARVDVLRKIIIDTVHALGSFCSDEVSDEFLAFVPEEARLVRAKAGPCPRRERATPTAEGDQAKPAPIPMFLTCPRCNTRHIDEGDFATKPHHTHSCQECGLTWRPAVVPTVGVQFLPGFKNEPKEGV